MGENSCLLSSTCLACGRFLESVVEPSATCEHCGSPVDGSDPAEPEKP